MHKLTLEFWLPLITYILTRNEILLIWLTGKEAMCYEIPEPRNGIHISVFMLSELGWQTVYAPQWQPLLWYHGWGVKWWGLMLFIFVFRIFMWLMAEHYGIDFRFSPVTLKVSLTSSKWSHINLLLLWYHGWCVSWLALLRLTVWWSLVLFIFVLRLYPCDWIDFCLVQSLSDIVDI